MSNIISAAFDDLKMAETYKMKLFFKYSFSSDANELSTLIDDQLYKLFD